MQNKIKKIYIQNKYFYRKTFLFFLFFIVVVICTILVGVQSKTVYVKTGFKTISFKEEKTSAISQNTIVTYFLKNQDKAIITSVNADSKNDNYNLLKDCIIQTPNIRNKVYHGKTETIEIDGDKNSFIIPNYMYLENHTNKQDNFIMTNELHGSFDNEIVSNLPFKINDDDLFLSGDNLYILTKTNYLKITKNSHLIYTKKDTQKETKTNKKTKINTDIKNHEDKKHKPEIYDITSVIMEVFGDKNYAILKSDVKIVNDNKNVNSQYAKIYFNNEQKPTDMFISKDIMITQDENIATSDFGFFDIQNNLILLYKNVFINSGNNKSNGEFYIYNVENKSSFTFNRYTILPQQEQRRVYDILNKLAKEVGLFDRNYILDVIKDNQLNVKLNVSRSSENFSIDRTKRTKVTIAH